MDAPLRALLAHGDYVRYAAARFMATLAWQMLAVAVGWQTYEVTRDPLALGMVGLVQFLPFFLLVLPAGQLADRADKRHVLIGAYLCEVVSAGVLLWFSLSGLTAASPIFIAMAFFGAGRAFWMPTGQAITPSLVPTHLFPRAVACNSTLYQTAGILGPAVGGGLYLLGPQVVYGTVVLLLATATVLVMAMRPVTADHHAPWQIQDTLQGLYFVFRRRTILGAISLDLFAVLLGGATAMLPVFAADVLKVGPVGLGILRTAPGVGAVAMAGYLTLRPITRHVGPWMFGGVGVFGVATLVFGASTHFWISLAALVVLGAGDMVSIYVRHMLVQLETPDALRGRVSAVSSIFIGSSNELGEFESGVTARIFGLVPSVLVGGTLTLCAVLGCLRLFPELRRMDTFPAPNRDAAPG